MLRVWDPEETLLRGDGQVYQILFGCLCCALVVTWLDSAVEETHLREPPLTQGLWKRDK